MLFILTRNHSIQVFKILAKRSQTVESTLISYFAHRQSALLQQLSSPSETDGSDEQRWRLICHLMKFPIEMTATKSQIITQFINVVVWISHVSLHQLHCLLQEQFIL